MVVSTLCSAYVSHGDFTFHRSNLFSFRCGQFVLFRLHDKDLRAKYFPARVVAVSHASQTVNLQWHEGNIYPPHTETPPSQFERSLRRCAEAILQQRELHEAMSVSKQNYHISMLRPNAVPYLVIDW